MTLALIPQRGGFLSLLYRITHNSVYRALGIPRLHFSGVWITEHLSLLTLTAMMATHRVTDFCRIGATLQSHPGYCLSILSLVIIYQ